MTDFHRLITYIRCYMLCIKKLKLIEMITIEKRKLELNIEEFREELIQVCKLIKKHNPSSFGITMKGINEHFGIKLKTTDYYMLCDELGYKTRLGKKSRYLSFDEIGVK